MIVMGAHNLVRVMRVRLFFRWYDLWVGAYWDRRARALYVCPLPMIGVRIEFAQKGREQ